MNGSSLLFFWMVDGYFAYNQGKFIFSCVVTGEHLPCKHPGRYLPQSFLVDIYREILWQASTIAFVVDPAPAWLVPATRFRVRGVYHETLWQASTIAFMVDTYSAAARLVSTTEPCGSHPPSLSW
jgi:hypothetical protein